MNPEIKFSAVTHQDDKSCLLIPRFLSQKTNVNLCASNALLQSSFRFDKIVKNGLEINHKNDELPIRNGDFPEFCEITKEYIGFFKRQVGKILAK